MARPIAISLHLGAHKTASTHLQKSLAQNIDILRDHGVAYLGPKYLRNKRHTFLDLFGLRPNGKSIGGRTGPEQVAKLAKGAGLLVISEENILGPTFSDLSPGVLYPQAEFRLERFFETVAPHGVNIFLSVREPSSWLASLYSQRVIGGDMRGFEDFVGPNRPDRLQWSDLIERLQGIRGDRKIFVWRKETYPEVATPVLRRMIGWHLGPKIRRIEGLVNESLSKGAIAQMLQWSHDKREGDPREWAAQARRLHPIVSDADVFDPWNHSEKTQSQRAYDRDLQRLDAMGKVEMIKPSRRSRG